MLHGFKLIQCPQRLGMCHNTNRLCNRRRRNFSPQSKAMKFCVRHVTPLAIPTHSCETPPCIMCAAVAALTELLLPELRSAQLGVQLVRLQSGLTFTSHHNRVLNKSSGRLGRVQTRRQEGQGGHTVAEKRRASDKVSGSGKWCPCLEPELSVRPHSHGVVAQHLQRQLAAASTLRNHRDGTSRRARRTSMYSVVCREYSRCGRAGKMDNKKRCQTEL